MLELSAAAEGSDRFTAVTAASALSRICTFLIGPRHLGEAANVLSSKGRTAGL